MEAWESENVELHESCHHCRGKPVGIEQRLGCGAWVNLVLGYM